MSDTIAAVVVTFNRKQLLLECLRALLKQTRPLDRIFLIDNASSDGTPEHLDQQGFLNNPLIEYVRLGQNTGGAGGFNEGLKRAFDAGYAWFWLMDDDVEAYPEALENLLPFTRDSECIHGKRIEPNGTVTVWGDQFDPVRITTRPIRDREFTSGVACHNVTVGCFEGMLISRHIVDEIGLPERELFICWDDTLYGFLASRVTNVLYANVQTLKRKKAIETVSAGPWGQRVSLSPLAAYYYQRNRFLIARRLGSEGLPFWIQTLRGLARSMLKDAFLNRDLSRARASLRGAIAGARWISTRDAN